MLPCLVTQQKIIVKTGKFSIPVGMRRSKKQPGLAAAESSKPEQRPPEKRDRRSLYDMSVFAWWKYWVHLAMPLTAWRFVACLNYSSFDRRKDFMMAGGLCVIYCFLPLRIKWIGRCLNSLNRVLTLIISWHLAGVMEHGGNFGPKPHNAESESQLSHFIRYIS